MNLYLGCPIWSFKGWVGNFYPLGTKPADYLFEYARRLTAIEGNTTFYAVPAPNTLEQWAQATPETFRFCAKVPRAISHAGRLADQVERATEFVRAMQRLGPRLGPMFLQLPPRYPPARLGDLRAFLEAWPAGVRLGVEVRHPDWFEPPAHGSLNQLLAERDMARVVIDTRPIRSLDGEKALAGSVYQTLLTARARKPNVPVLPEPTTDFVFVRYIGHPKLEINLPFLDEWAGFIVSQLRQGVDAYIICHSPENLTAPHLCRELHRRVAKSLPLPALPWEATDSNEPGRERLL